MAEQPNTPEAVGQGQAPLPDATGLGTPPNRPEPATAVASPGPAHSSDADRIRQYEQQIERYHHNIRGWEQRAKEADAENTKLREQLQQTTTYLQNVGAVLTGKGNATERQQPKNLREAIDRYLSGDDAALENFSPWQSDASSVEERVDRHLAQYVETLGRQQAVTRNHPEMGDPSSPVYAAVWDQYETFANDPSTRSLFPEDPNQMVLMTSPDGQSQRPMDLRILAVATPTVKATLSRQEGEREGQRRREVGDTVTGNGRTVTAPDDVDASELFSDKEKQQIMAMIQTSSWPKGWPRTPREAYQHLLKIDPTDKAKRLDAYRGRRAS